MKFLVSQTFQCVTPESAEHGDYSDQGYEFKETPYTLRELLREIKDQGNDNVSFWGTTMSIYGWNYTSDYKTGEDTQKCLHIKASNRALKRLERILK